MVSGKIADARGSFAARLIRQGRRFSLWLALCGIFLGAAAESESTGAVEARLEAYRAGAERLRADVAERGSIRYEEVVALAYGEPGLEPAVLAAKSAWREFRGGEAVFMTDYDTVAASVPVRMLVETPEDEISSLVGMYFPRRNLIKLASAGDPFVALHESGHALQRKSLRRQQAKHAGNVAWNDLAATVSARSYDEQLSPDFIERLRYLVSQDEFEVRLQDLNRFFAVAVRGRPIADERDALAALLGLGMPLRYAEVAAACEGAGIAIEEEAFRQMRAEIDAAPRASSEMFGDARELLVLRRLAQELDETLWQVVLRKILVEAPGHF